jgi:hypothetical protein
MMSKSRLVFLVCENDNSRCSKLHSISIDPYPHRSSLADEERDA